MTDRIDDICAAPQRVADVPTRPHVPAIYLASVYECQSPEEAEELLSGESPGYVYQRDGHPNADVLADKCRRLHAADWALIGSSGMATMSLALLSTSQAGDHILASHQLYGRSLQLLTREASRLGIGCTLVNTSDLEATEKALRPNTRLLVVETITNPMLRVSNVSELAKLATANSTSLLVDNTFATPVLCQPLKLGAHLVLESISKMMNGHSDVMLGMLAGSGVDITRVRDVLSAWGLAASPLDCWLAGRGLSTLHLRMRQAFETAHRVAEFLNGQPAVSKVSYPGLASHPDYELARRQFAGSFGSVVTFTLEGGLPAAERLIATMPEIPFCPSLGEVSTTLSHPASTSHRRLSSSEQESLGIHGGTIRLSVGVESAAHVIDVLGRALGQM